MNLKKIANIIIKDYKKIKSDHSYYVYIINVFLVNGEHLLVPHRYNDFFNFQCSLLSKFPKEAGEEKGQDRIIPYIPGKTAIGEKSHIANKRIEALEEYCNDLIKLPPLISESDFVLQFFTPTEQDLMLCTEKFLDSKSAKLGDVSMPQQLEKCMVLKTYKKQSTSEISVPKGEIVEVMAKNDMGWWLVIHKIDKGWFPQSYLTTVNSFNSSSHSTKSVFENGDSLVCINTVTSTRKNEISLTIGSVVEVCQRRSDGWWLVQRGSGPKGLVPANILRSLKSGFVPYRLDTTTTLTMTPSSSGVPPCPPPLLSKPRSMENLLSVESPNILSQNRRLNSSTSDVASPLFTRNKYSVPGPKPPVCPNKPTVSKPSIRTSAAINSLILRLEKEDSEDTEKLSNKDTRKSSTKDIKPACNNGIAKSSSSSPKLPPPSSVVLLTSKSKRDNNDILVTSSVSTSSNSVSKLKELFEVK